MFFYPPTLLLLLSLLRWDIEKSWLSRVCQKGVKVSAINSSYFFLHCCCYCWEEGWKLKYELQLAPDRFLHYGRKLRNSFCEHLQQQSLIKISAEQKNCFLFAESCLHSDFLKNYKIEAVDEMFKKIHPHLR